MNNKNALQNFRKAFFREKYRFDQGNAFLVFVNFALLVATLINQNGGNQDYIKYYVAGGLLATWFLGYILDKVVQVQDIQERVILKRSPIWKQNFARHDDHEEKLSTLIKKLENIEKQLEKTVAKTTRKRTVANSTKI
jgi:hypothetical protein